MFSSSLSQSAARTPFVEWLLELAERRGWNSGRQAAKYLGVNQAVFATWIRGEYLPRHEHQRRLARQTDTPIEEIERLVEASRPTSRSEGWADSAGAPVADLLKEMRALREEVAEVRAFLVSPTVDKQLEDVLRGAGVGGLGAIDDRLPVMFSGVVWEELTDAEKAGVIALAKRLMGRPHGKMGRRAPEPEGE